MYHELTSGTIDAFKTIWCWEHDDASGVRPKLSLHKIPIGRSVFWQNITADLLPKLTERQIDLRVAGHVG